MRTWGTEALDAEATPLISAPPCFSAHCPNAFWALIPPTLCSCMHCPNSFATILAIPTVLAKVGVAAENGVTGVCGTCGIAIDIGPCGGTTVAGVRAVIACAAVATCLTTVSRLAFHCFKALSITFLAPTKKCQSSRCTWSQLASPNSLYS